MFALKNQDWDSIIAGLKSGSNNSRQQQRVWEEELEKDELLKEIASILGSQEKISESASITQILSNNPNVINLSEKYLSAAKKPNEQEDKYSARELLAFVEKNDIESAINLLIDDIDFETLKDKNKGKKKLAQISELIIALEKILSNSKAPNVNEVANGLRTQQDKLLNLMRDYNPQKSAEYLKESELRKSLNQALATAALMPDSLKTSQESVRNQVQEAALRNNPQRNQLNDLASTRIPNDRPQTIELVSRNNQPNPIILANATRLSVLSTSSQNVAATNMAAQQSYNNNFQPSLASSNAAAQVSQANASAALQTNLQSTSFQASYSHPQTASSTQTIAQIENNPPAQSFKPEQSRADSLPPAQTTPITSVSPQNSPLATPPTQEKLADKPPTTGHVHNGCCGTADVKKVDQALLDSGTNAFQPRTSTHPTQLPTTQEVSANKAAFAGVDL